MTCCNYVIVQLLTSYTWATQRSNELAYYWGRNEVRWHPGQEASLAPPRSNLRSFGSEL